MKGPSDVPTENRAKITPMNRLRSRSATRSHDHLDHQDDAAAAAVDPLHRAPPDQHPRRGRAAADAAPEHEGPYDADGELALPEDVG